MLDSIGVRNEVDVTAYDQGGKPYTAHVEFEVRINEVGFGGPRGWVYQVNAFPSLTPTSSIDLGDALCKAN